LVEDDENKRLRLLEFFKKNYPQMEIVVAYSLNSGVRLVRQELPDIVILDMTLPNFDQDAEESGGYMHQFGGREFLRQLDRFDIVIPVIVVTQFETFGKPPQVMGIMELDERLSREHPDQYRGAIYYNAAIHDWAAKLKNIVDQTIKGGGLDA